MIMMHAASMKAPLLPRATLVFFLLSPVASWAVDCGTDGWCPCPSGGRCLAGHATCEEACGLTGAANDDAAVLARRRNAFILQQQAQAAAAQAAARKREEERREREEREERERQQEFIRNRDEGVHLLRGIGTKVTENGGSELRGDTRVDTGIRELAPAKKERDLSGAGAAWKQLNCAAGIANDAFGALDVVQKPGREPDFDEFNYLSGEAVHALNGEPLGVECPKGAAAPRAYGAAAAVLYKHKYLQLLEHSQELASTLGRTITQRREAHARVVAAKKAAAVQAAPMEDAPPMRQAAESTQAAIEPGPAKVVKKKIDARAAALAAAREAERLEQELTRREDETRKELADAKDLAQKIEKGDPEALRRLEGGKKK